MRSSRSATELVALRADVLAAMRRIEAGSDLPVRSVARTVERPWAPPVAPGVRMRS